MLLYEGEHGIVIRTSNGCGLGCVCWCDMLQEYVTTHSCEHFCEYYSSCNTTCLADNDLEKYTVEEIVRKATEETIVLAKTLH